MAKCLIHLSFLKKRAMSFVQMNLLNWHVGTKDRPLSRSASSPSDKICDDKLMTCNLSEVANMGSWDQPTDDDGPIYMMLDHGIRILEDEVPEMETIAEDGITTTLEEEPVMADAAEDGITTTLEEEPVMEVAAEDAITTTVEEEPVMADAAEDDIISTVKEEPVMADAVEDGITTTMEEER
ncbi:probable serine/threonine-protein kinase kinX [Eleutherodactylus coqui]|uniref:probable serine/threonine-protein kinase kinX n=1 Tax=Eleutherodactylus coqui TaxID=57060 RepID=UPI0034635A64